jgi:23S rRNA pseudouridine1911/1915/1917 synthase
MSAEGTPEASLPERSLDVEVALDDDVVAPGDLTAVGPVEILVAEEQEGKRLDVLLAEQFMQFSRVHLRRVIDAGGVTVDGRAAKVAYRLKAGQKVHFLLPDMPRTGPIPEDIPLDILYEDEHLAAINKPPGMVVHPAKGHWSGTLTSALAFHFAQLSTTGGPTRPGVVHRLDRDTSGVIVIAKTDAAHLNLAKQFEDRTTEKEYATIVVHGPDRDRDIIRKPIGPHPHQRDKMAIREDHPESRAAETFYEVLERFDGFAYLKILPKTGRTHQIRVHLGSINAAVLCDRLYGSRAMLTRGELTRKPRDETVLLDRQALHARRLKIKHPISGEVLEFTAELPADMQCVLAALREYR